MWVNFSISENEFLRIQNDIKAGRLREICDVIVLPDMTRAAILGVQTPATLPAEEGALRYRLVTQKEFFFHKLK